MATHIDYGRLPQRLPVEPGDDVFERRCWLVGDAFYRHSKASLLNGITPDEFPEGKIIAICVVDSGLIELLRAMPLFLNHIDLMGDHGSTVFSEPLHRGSHWIVSLQ